MVHEYRTVRRWLGLAGWGTGALLLLVPIPVLAVQRAEPAPRLLWRLAEPGRGVPAADAQSAYFLTQRHELVAASASTGRIRWRVPLESTSPTFGSRVVVHGDLVVAGDYDLVGVDRRTGERRWAFVSDDNGGAGMHLGDAQGGVVFSGSLTGRLHAIDLQTGRARWSVTVGHPAHTTTFAPVAAGSLVAASFSDFSPSSTGGVVLVDSRRGDILWRRVVPNSVGASGNPVIAGGVVVVAAGDGILHAFDATDGRSRWTWPAVPRLAALQEQDFRPLVVSGRLVLAGSLSGEIVAHDLVTRRVVWRREPVHASVSLTGMVARDDVLFVPYFSGHLVALRVGDGSELWRLGGDHAQFRWAPLLAGARMFLSGSESFALFRYNGTPHRRIGR
jgi:outer membrane protein assembly factor BamB